MEPHNNLRLLFILLCLVISINAAPPLSPTAAPQPSPSSSSEQAFSYAQYFPSSSSSDPTPSSGGESAAQPSDVGLSSKLHSSGAVEQKDATDPQLLTQQLNAVTAPQTKQPDLSLASNIPANPNPEVKKICDSTDYPAVCLTTVLPLLSSGKVTVETVLQASVKASDEFAKNALSMVKKESAKPGVSPKLLSTLKDCKDGYDTAVENFEKTMNAFTAHDVGTMRTMLSAVITFVGDCEDGFAEMQENSPLSTYAKQLTSMTSNCLAISALMN